MSIALLLAILAQSADAAVTCRTLSQGGRELNPLVPASCRGVVLQKSALLGATFLLPPRWRTTARVGLAAAGAAGVGVTLTLSRR